MSTIPSFPEGQIESLARLLGECGSGTDISRVLRDRSLADDSGESTKWRRLYWVFLSCQRQHGCANRIIDFTQSFLIPARFVGRGEEFETIRQQLNVILSFAGLVYETDGKFRECKVARTLDEAEARVKTIRAKFQGRLIHAEVLKYCRAELLQENYFHAVFEASKGLAQRIREMSGIQADGADLVDRVFSIERPILAINTLQTQTEKSEHKGFAALLKGCFAAVRNPLAHEPKILWKGEDDAADYLSLISLLHRKLDDSVSTKLGS
ncbi:MAG: TIGR02391 family protein [Chlorobiales bacterium]|nr:TIGR02391 family protein [Chlorobiales bacterium]